MSAVNYVKVIISIGSVIFICTLQSLQNSSASNVILLLLQILSFF